MWSDWEHLTETRIGERSCDSSGASQWQQCDSPRKKGGQLVEVTILTQTLPSSNTFYNFFLKAHSSLLVGWPSLFSKPVGCTGVTLPGRKDWWKSVCACVCVHVHTCMCVCMYLGVRECACVCTCMCIPCMCDVFVCVCTCTPASGLYSRWTLKNYKTKCFKNTLLLLSNSKITAVFTTHGTHRTFQNIHKHKHLREVERMESIHSNHLDRSPDKHSTSGLQWTSKYTTLQGLGERNRNENHNIHVQPESICTYLSNFKYLRWKT